MTTPRSIETRLRNARAGRRKFALLIGFAAIVLVAADWLAGGASRGWVLGTALIDLTTDPAGASVSVDGTRSGATPIVIKTATGARTLLVQHPYHPPHFEQVELARGERLVRSITLEPAFGALLIASNPKGAHVTIDGVAQDGVTPLALARISAGLHEIELRIPGRTTQRLTAEVLPDSHGEVSAELERARTGVLRVDVVPADAEAMLIDEFGDQYPAGTPVPVGDYRLQVRRAGYGAVERAVRVAAGARTEQVTLERQMGQLDLDVHPASARVTVTWRDHQGTRTAEYASGMALPAGPATVEARAAGHRTERRTLQIPAGPLAASLRLRPILGRPGDRIQDALAAGGQAPPMVVVPAGQLTMNATTGQGTGSQSAATRVVRLDIPFAIGIHEVTRGDWARYAASSGTPTPPARAGETDAHPVTRVRFEDAVDYTAWLTQQTGERYRLPSAAEWEYAARAGETGAYPGGALEGVCKFANVADAALATHFRSWETLACDDGYERTAPVGQFAPNAWGLYDVIGNAAELTATCWEAAPDSVTRGGSDCSILAARGGSWDTAADGITLSAGEPASRAGDDRGFRVLREL